MKGLKGVRKQMNNFINDENLDKLLNVLDRIKIKAKIPGQKVKWI